MKTRKRRVFKKRDYTSSDGMLTSVWGPGLWHYMHTMSFNYPTNPSLKDKKNYYNFIINLQVSEQEVIKRLTARGRADDKPEVIKQRLREHEKQVGPVIKHFEDQLINIKAEGAEPEVIANKIIKRIER